jgi:hypothetical protein
MVIQYGALIFKNKLYKQWASPAPTFPMFRSCVENVKENSAREDLIALLLQRALIREEGSLPHQFIIQVVK